MSSLALTPSFVLSFMFSNRPNTLSHTFFSMCMTWMQCRTSRSFQYGKSQNTDLFFQYADSSFPFFLILIEHNIDVTFSKSSIPLKGHGFTPVSVLSLNCLFHL